MSDRKLCDWCREREIRPRRSGGARKDEPDRFCGTTCRQAAHRLRTRRATLVHDAKALRIAYADPPYPGFAKRLYQHEPSYAGEVDHAQLIAELASGFDGWALSTSASALRQLLPLCPPDVRVCAWVKTIGVSSRSFGPHNAWEPVIVKPARLRPPGVRDWLAAMPARGGGTLPGRKPLAFAAWLFGLLGMAAGDELCDLFPGTGIIGRAWREVSASARAAPDARAAPGARVAASCSSRVA